EEVEQRHADHEDEEAAVAQDPADLEDAGGGGVTKNPAAGASGTHQVGAGAVMTVFMPVRFRSGRRRRPPDRRPRPRVHRWEVRRERRPPTWPRGWSCGASPWLPAHRRTPRRAGLGTWPGLAPAWSVAPSAAKPTP